VRFALVSATLGHLVLNLLAACWCFFTHMASHGCPSIHHFFSLATLYRVCVILSTPLIFCYLLDRALFEWNKAIVIFFIRQLCACELMSMNGRRAESFYFQTA
jgi:hypothetical protein